jgi:hypothetical protein
MKRILLVTGFLILLIGTLYSQDTISHIISGCVYNEKSTIDEAPCPPGVFFNYTNDTLYIHGTIGANCCGTHFAIVQILRDTVFIATLDTGDLCTCVCGFCFELKVPATTVDTIVSMNGIIYNSKGILSSKNNNNNDDLIKILPNPIDNELRIIFDHEYIKNAYINDLSGKTIHYIECSNQREIHIDTSTWPNGLYLINFKSSDNTLITRKIIKE